jgi:hypothetical protein
MKTASTTTLTKKLTKLNPTKNTIAYKMVQEVINGKSFIRPCYTSGSGRHISNQDHSQPIEAILKEIGVEYVVGNDAPRGGLTGKFIQITTKIKA